MDTVEKKDKETPQKMKKERRGEGGGTGRGQRLTLGDFLIPTKNHFHGIEREYDEDIDDIKESVDDQDKGTDAREMRMQEKKKGKNRFVNLSRARSCVPPDETVMSKQVGSKQTNIFLLEDEETLKQEVDKGEFLGMVAHENGRWVREDAAVDSGAVDNVMHRDKFPHLPVLPTPESARGDSWTGVGGQTIEKEGEIILPWFSDAGMPKRSRIKVGKVGRTLISTSRLNECGYDAYLTKVRPRLVNQRTGETIALRKSGRMYILPMWIWVPGKPTGHEPNKDAGFTRPH